MLSENFKNLHLQLSSDDIRKIDEWKLRHGMKSRSEAIRSIIRIVTNTDEVNNSPSISVGLSEKENDNFLKPSNINPNDLDYLVEVIRKVVKEELKN